jgi:hypothetical protein
MERSPDLAIAGPAGAVVAAGELLGRLDDELWAAKDAAALLAVSVELERLRSHLAAVQARVVVEVEATEAAKTAGWVSPGDYLTSVSGGRRGHGQRLLRTARGLCGDRTATLLALTAGDVSPEQRRRGRRGHRPAPGRPVDPG